MKALLALAFVATIAQAQSGVPLTTPAAADARTTAAMKQPGVVSVVPVKANPAALESNVIAIDIKGKTYRFTGKKESRQSFQMVNGKRVEVTVETWEGRDGSNVANLSRDASGVSGSININGQVFTLYDYALVETSTAGGRMLEEPTPAMLENERQRREAARKTKP